MEESQISFSVYCHTNDSTVEFDLLENDSVEVLKINIHSIFDIPPIHQIIDGWKVNPDYDNTILRRCCNLDGVNVITVLDARLLEDHNFPRNETIHNVNEDNNSDGFISSENSAAISSFRKISSFLATSHIKFDFISLKDAIQNYLRTTKDKRKAILLYLHNPDSQFSKYFLNMLQNRNISKILMDHFIFIGWEVQSDLYQDSLRNDLETEDVKHCFVETKKYTALIIQNVMNEIRVTADMTEGTTEHSFLHILHSVSDFIEVDKRMEDPKRETIDSKTFQKIMADRLGDRDYDCFKLINQAEYIKKKIGFALFGPPNEINKIEENKKREDCYGYEKKQEKIIDVIYEAILKNSELYAERKGQVEFACVFNCTEPLPKEKESRKKNDKDYDPDSDILPVPVFVLRQCRRKENLPEENKNPCRIFIDNVGRKYNSWEQYLSNNVLNKCIMVVPKDGKYTVVKDAVVLETYESPACTALNEILKGADIGSTVAGVGSSGVVATALVASFTTLAFPPALLIGAGITGAISGAYGVARGVGSLVDKIKHEESLNVTNAEARGIYFNLLAGSLGFVGAGATAAVSQLATKGFVIGKGVQMTVNTLNAANICLSGASILNSSYEVADQWFNENQPPSWLTLVQLSSSVLFFGHAVYNFRTCQTIITEAQANYLKSYSDSLRSNRHRKTFNKLLKETIRRNDADVTRGHAEVIKTVRKMPNKDDIFGVLTRSNKAMNKKGIKFFAKDGKITLNGKSVNINEMSLMKKREVNNFLSNLPRKTVVTTADTSTLVDRFSLNNWSSADLHGLAEYAVCLIGSYGSDIQGMLLRLFEDACKIILDEFEKCFADIFPVGSTYSQILSLVFEFFGEKCVLYLENYMNWRQTGHYSFYKEDFIHVPTDPATQYTWIFKKFIHLYCGNDSMKEQILKELLDFAYEWITRKVLKYQEKLEEKQCNEAEQSSDQPKKVPCTICSGYYFTHK